MFISINFNGIVIIFIIVQISNTLIHKHIKTTFLNINNAHELLEILTACAQRTREN